MSGMTITTKVCFESGRRSKKEIREGEAKPQKPGRVPRVTKLMALAIRFDQLLRDGVVKDQSELARLGHVTRARMSQIMGLLNLAPDIQEALLSLPRVTSGKDPVTEKELREVVAEVDWGRQRRRWGRMGSRTEC